MSTLEERQRKIQALTNRELKSPIPPAAQEFNVPESCFTRVPTWAFVCLFVLLFIGTSVTALAIAQRSHKIAHQVAHAEEFASLRVFTLDFGTIDHHGQQIVPLPDLNLSAVLGYSVNCFSIGALRLDIGSYLLIENSYGDTQLEFIVSDPALFSTTCRFMAWVK